MSTSSPRCRSSASRRSQNSADHRRSNRSALPATRANSRPKTRNSQCRGLCANSSRGPHRSRLTVSPDEIRQLWERPIDYVHHDSFTRRSAEAVILGPAPAVPVQRLVKAPSGLPAYLASLYDVPLLTREQEAYHFRKMNYLKYRAARLRKTLDPAKVSRDDLDCLKNLLQQAEEVKNLLIRSNLRLVVAVVRKYARSGFDFSEMVSDGNLSLMRAVEKFDFGRGFKFSTYATFAIRNNFVRSTAAEYSLRDRYRTGIDEMFAASTDDGSNEYQQQRLHEQRQESVRQVLQLLSERERNVLVGRFGLRHQTEPQTLEQMGAEQGVTKERIRQIEKRAINKLRELTVGRVGELCSMN